MDKFDANIPKTHLHLRKNIKFTVRNVNINGIWEKCVFMGESIPLSIKLIQKYNTKALFLLLVLSRIRSKKQYWREKSFMNMDIRQFTYQLVAGVHEKLHEIAIDDHIMVNRRK